MIKAECCLTNVDQYGWRESEHPIKMEDGTILTIISYGDTFYTLELTTVSDNGLILSGEELTASVRNVIDQLESAVENITVSRIRFVNEKYDPFFNQDGLLKCLELLNRYFRKEFEWEVNFEINTVGLHKADFSNLPTNARVVFDLPVVDGDTRYKYKPELEKMTLEQLGDIRSPSGDQTLLIQLSCSPDLELTRKYFDPRYFAIKFSYPDNGLTLFEGDVLSSHLKKLGYTVSL